MAERNRLKELLEEAGCVAGQDELDVLPVSDDEHAGDDDWDRGPFPACALDLHTRRIDALQQQLVVLHRHWQRRDVCRPDNTEPLVAPMVNTATFVAQLRLMADHLERTRTQHEGEV